MHYESTPSVDQIVLYPLGPKKKRATPWAARFLIQGVESDQLATSSFFTAR